MAFGMTYGSLEFSIVTIFELCLGVVVFCRYYSSCVQLRQRNVAGKLMRLKAARQSGEEVGGQVQGFSLSVLKGMKVYTVPKERCNRCAKRTLDGFRLANKSVVYHDSILGELEMLVEEAYADRLSNLECCE